MAVATERSEREPLGVSAKLAPLSLGLRVGIYWYNGKENGNYYNGLYSGYIGDV